MPIAAPMALDVESLRRRPKSLAMLDPMALMSESAVEMIATNTAAPISAVRVGLVAWTMKLMRTLDPGAIVNPNDLASIPKRIGIVQIDIVRRAA